MKSLLKQKRVWLLLLYFVSLALSGMAQYHPDFAEYVFTRGIYRAVSQAISRLTGLVPFSLSEIVISIGAVILLCLFVLYCRKVIKGGADRIHMVWSGILNLLCAGAVISLWFTVLCGVNYYRYSFSAISGLTVEPSSTQQLYNLCLSLTKTANELRSQIHEEDGRGVTKPSGTFYDTARAADRAMEGLAERYPVMDGYYPPPKPVLMSALMSRTQLTGMFSTLTMEANINTAATAYTIPATMCHELSHLRGFMREDEANFIAYLACRQSDDLQVRYSGTMLALVYAGNQLYTADYERYKKLRANYSDGVRRDMNADYEYWKQFDDTTVSKVSNKLNDTYLKMNNQSDGVKSYGRMVDLLLADYKRDAGK